MGNTKKRYSKRESQALRRLAGTAYERELGAALEELEAEFRRWRAGEIDAFELNERIHRHHDGEARDLYKLYNYSRDDAMMVARGVENGLLEPDEVNPELLDKLEPIRDFFRADASEGRAADEE